MHGGYLHSLRRAIAHLFCETKFATHPIVSHLGDWRNLGTYVLHCITVSNAIADRRFEKSGFLEVTQSHAAMGASPPVFGL